MTNFNNKAYGNFTHFFRIISKPFEKMLRTLLVLKEKI